MLTTGGTQSAPTFWKRPEGKVGAVLLAFLGFGALIGLKAALPWLIELSKDLLKLYIYGGAVLGITFFLMLRPVRRTIRLHFETFAQSIYDGFIRRNPDKVMDNHLRKMGQKVEEITLHKRNLGKQRGVLKQEIQSIEEEKEQLLSKASQAKTEYEKGGPNASQFRASMASSASMVGGRERALSSLNAMLNKIDATLAVVDKMDFYSRVMHSSLADTIKLKKRLKDIAITAHGAVSAAYDIAFGGGESGEDYKKALEAAETLTGQKMGDIDVMFSDLEIVINELSLQGKADENSGMRSLAEFEKKYMNVIEKDLHILEQKGDQGIGALFTQEPVKVTAQQHRVTEGANTASKYLH